MVKPQLEPDAPVMLLTRGQAARLVTDLLERFSKLGCQSTSVHNVNVIQNADTGMEVGLHVWEYQEFSRVSAHIICADGSPYTLIGTASSSPMAHSRIHHVVNAWLFKTNGYPTYAACAAYMDKHYKESGDGWDHKGRDYCLRDVKGRGMAAIRQPGGWYIIQDLQRLHPTQLGSRG